MERRRAPLWILAATALTALYTLVVLVLPASGITFLGDDFRIFALCVEGRPRGWLVPFLQHWMPLGIAVLDLEHSVFGRNYLGYVLVTWAIHAASVFLVGLLLGARAADDRAGALAALAFGVVTAWRSHFWWASAQVIFQCFFFLVLVSLAIERQAEYGGRFLRVAAVAMAGATLTWSAGLTCGPALALEAFVLTKDRGARTLLAVWAGYVILYIVFALGTVPSALPRTPAELGSSALVLAQAIGLGFLRTVPVLDIEPTPVNAAALTLLYATAIAVLAFSVSPRTRTRLLLAHVTVLAFLVPVALTRWPAAHSQRPSFQNGQYAYVASLAWTTALALALAPLLKRWPFVTAAVALVFIGWLGTRNANAARFDESFYSPTVRRVLHEPEIVDALALAARNARGPIYEAKLPYHLGFGFTTAREAVLTASPETRAVWTSVRDEASVAPYLADPVLRNAFPELTTSGRR